VCDWSLHPSRSDLQQAMREGCDRALMEAGATVIPRAGRHAPASTWACSTAEDVCVATHNRNFRGRMGHRDAEIYLASSYRRMRSAIAGTIADPREVLQVNCEGRIHKFGDHNRHPT